MAKIVYLIGAGASAHTLPIVSQIPIKLEEVIKDVSNLKELETLQEKELERIKYVIDAQYNVSEFTHLKDSIKYLVEKSVEYKNLKIYFHINLNVPQASPRH